MLLIVSVVLTMAGQFLAANPFSRSPPKTHGPPLLPSLDPFYTLDNPSWESSSPGTILRSRSVTISSPHIDRIIIQSAHQFLYRTSNAHGCPSYAVTTVIIPTNASTDKFLSYQIAYDSPDNNCSPSYWVQEGAPLPPYGIFRELGSLIQSFLTQGIPINIPDYEGVDASFTVGTQSGYAVLDSLRAVTRSEKITGIKSYAQAAMVGYSGGALASEWASELHSRYAPDVKVSGAAIGGLPTNITKTFFAIDGTKSAGLIPASLNGIANTFSCLAEYLNRHLLPEQRESFYAARRQCSNGSRNSVSRVSEVSNRSMVSYFDNGNRIIYDQATLMNTIGAMGSRGIPDFPLYVWKGTRDEIAPSIEDTDALVMRFCGMTNITYVRVDNANHFQARVAGLPGAQAFLGDMLRGKRLDGCTTRSIPVVDEKNGS